MFCSFGQPYQTCLVRLCVPRFLSGLFTYVRRFFSIRILKIANEEEALVNVTEIGEIETEETPSCKGNQSKGEATKFIVAKRMQVQQTSVCRENRHESFAY